MATDPRGKAATLALRRRLLRYRDGDAGRGGAHKARTSGASLQAPAPAASRGLSRFRRLWPLRPSRAQPACLRGRIPRLPRRVLSTPAAAAGLLGRPRPVVARPLDLGPARE